MSVFLPYIGKVVPWISNVTSNGWVVITGSKLGNDEGELWLKGLKKWNGTPLGDVKLKIASEPGKDFWTPTMVVAFIPAISEVMDQPVSLRIKTAEGVWSNAVQVLFRAEQDLKRLPPWDVAIACSEESDQDQCNNVWDFDQGTDIFCAIPSGAPFLPHLPVTEGDGTFSAFHWTCIGDSEGTDFFSVSLLNGWTVSSADMIVFAGQATASGLPQNGTSFVNVKVDWSNVDAPYARYRVDVWIEGPKGVPHK